jgi:hypothetical protein
MPSRIVYYSETASSLQLRQPRQSLNSGEPELSVSNFKKRNF